MFQLILVIEINLLVLILSIAIADLLHLINFFKITGFITSKF